MTGNVALDIFIGLVFVYLLYSLFATVILEIISTNLNIRGRNLKRGIFSMLNDNRKDISRWEKLMLYFLSLFGGGMSQTKQGLAKDFYDSVGIKYMAGWGWIGSGPSNISAKQFVTGLLNVMADNAIDQRSQAQLVKNYLEANTNSGESKTGTNYLLFLFNDANGDMDKFKIRVEEWYDEMMMVVTEWYKKRMQIWLFIIGFFLAWSFNLNTLYITKILSLNNKARDQMVQLASAYLENNSGLSNLDKLTEKGLQEYYKEVSKQSKQASDVLSLPKELPIKVKIQNHKMNEADFIARKDSIISYIKVDDYYMTFEQPKELLYLNVGSYIKRRKHGDSIKIIVENFDLATFDPSRYFWRYQIWGYLITALGISLGAPFWFDLLNKLMQLRGAITHKQSASSGHKHDENHILIKG